MARERIAALADKGALKQHHDAQDFHCKRAFHHHFSGTFLDERLIAGGIRTKGNTREQQRVGRCSEIDLQAANRCRSLVKSNESSLARK